jgi:hypothetical protein
MMQAIAAHETHREMLVLNNAHQNSNQKVEILWRKNLRISPRECYRQMLWTNMRSLSYIQECLFNG